ncbi:protein pangolin, isoforms A/H/I/S isoform X2 [Copidosoma floridanum]|uniref:protein pangolin, isoforms A/H/I/S isoform X2 n=1 Tax=Copidosoma floridanum TaxID=29053 RepID=UPI0006C9D80C|nr:protein pangolin, isoforms A/H/I/S isoform X2 [Copidosoma floridanum]
MPHVSSSGGGDDLGSEDEVKIFKDEGEDEKRSSENLTEEKSSLIDLTESEEKVSLVSGSYSTTGKTTARSDLSPVFGKVDPTPHTSSFNMGYLVSPYPYPNGAGGPIPVSMASKMGLAGAHASGLPFFCPNGEHLTQPPPAHMGIPPYGALDAGKAAAAAGLTRTPMYPFSAGQYPYPMLSPEMTQVAASWHTPSMYPISPASAGFRSPYPTSLPISSSSLPSDLYRFSPTSLMPPHPGLSPHAHALASHALVSSAPKADHSTLDHNHRSSIEQKNSSSLPADNTKNQDTGQQNNQGNNMKKCRARFGLDQQSQWCKPCRRKKKCIRYMGEGGDGDADGDGEAEDEHSDNLGSVGEAGTPEDDESLSSPGGLSGLSSLASPSLVLPSPSSLASPCPLTPPVLIGPSSHQPPQQPPLVAVQQPQPVTPHRNPVGTNPHDINNPLSVNQLTGQCTKTEQPGPQPSNPAISVT